MDKYIVNQYAEKGHSVLYGDFNARTGSEFDYIESDIFDPYTITTLVPLYLKHVKLPFESPSIRPFTILTFNDMHI
jgi:hypothetical protein